MNKKLKAASVLLYIVALLFVALGAVYSLTPGLMPYHEKLIGKTYQELDPKLAVLVIFALRVIGAAYLAMGGTLALLVAKPLREGYAFTRWIILILVTVNCLPVLRVTLTVGNGAPWWAILVMMLMSFVAFFLARPAKE